MRGDAQRARLPFDHVGEAVADSNTEEDSPCRS